MRAQQLPNPKMPHTGTFLTLFRMHEVHFGHVNDVILRRLTTIIRETANWKSARKDEDGAG